MSGDNNEYGATFNPRDEKRTARLEACLGADTVQSLTRRRVAVVGTGALGGPVLHNLAMLGIGEFLLVDPGVVEPVNLGNQGFDSAHVGLSKVQARMEQIKRVQPSAVVYIHPKRLETLGRGVLRGCDLVISCLDNLAARILLNEICIELQIPWIDGATDGSGKFMLGRVASFGAHPDAPCFICSFDREQLSKALASEHRGCPSWWDEPNPSRPTLSIPPECGVMAGLQCIEAIKRLRGNVGNPISTELLVDLDSMKMHQILPARNPNCLNHHETFGNLVSLSAGTSLGATLTMLKGDDGDDATIMLHGKSFIAHIRCSACGRQVPIGKIDLLLQSERTCCPCGNALAPNPFSRNESIDVRCCAPFLERTWEEIGLPANDIISGYTGKTETHFLVGRRSIAEENSHA